MRDARFPAHTLMQDKEGGGLAMTFEEVLTQALAMLQRQGRVSYRASSASLAWMTSISKI